MARNVSRRRVASADRPNILLLMADDLGFGDLSSRGNHLVSTPNLDRLRREGTDFMDFQLVQSVCSPSRAGALTGRFSCHFCIHIHLGSTEHNAQYDMVDWLDPQAPTIPRILKEHAGYSCAHYGKWHLSIAQDEVPGSPSALQFGYDEAGGDTGNVPELAFWRIFDAESLILLNLFMVFDEICFLC